MARTPRGGSIAAPAPGFEPDPFSEVTVCTLVRLEYVLRLPIVGRVQVALTGVASEYALDVRGQGNNHLLRLL